MASNQTSVWIAQMPDGRWTLLMSQQGLPGWWHEACAPKKTVSEILDVAKGKGIPIDPKIRKAVKDAARPKPVRHQHNVHYPNQRKDRSGLTPRWREVLLILMKNADYETGIVRMSQREIAETVGRDVGSTAGISYALNALNQLGHIEILDLRQGTPGRYKLLHWPPRFDGRKATADEIKRADEIEINIDPIDKVLDVFDEISTRASQQE